MEDEDDDRLVWEMRSEVWKDREVSSPRVSDSESVRFTNI